MQQKQEYHQEISLAIPGKKVELCQQMISQLKRLDWQYKNRLTFFGGHPVSMTRNSCNAIFSKESLKMGKNGLQSPYLVCEKTDGVRYILIITRYGQYMVSREGQSSVCAYEVKTDISTNWPQFAKQSSYNQGNSFSFLQIVQILDGQLIIDSEEDQKNRKFRFLIFDILVHFGEKITKKPLGQRMQYINKFMRANQFQKQVSSVHLKGQIQCKVKDFFRLSSPKFNVSQFLLKKYIKCLPHQNDGLIYNNENCEYVFGRNEGYIKWKPPHLNTLDFFVVPNTNYIQKYGKKVIDLYLASRDQDSGNYTRVFYNFTIVSQESFEKIERQTEQKKQQKSKRQQQSQGEQQNQKINYFLGVIAECSYKDTLAEQKEIFKEIFSVQQPAEQIQQMIMKKNYNEHELAVVKQLQKTIYMKCWQIYKIRNDKDMPNNQNVAKRVEESIKDNINDVQLIKRNKQLLMPSQQK